MTTSTLRPVPVDVRGGPGRLGSEAFVGRLSDIWAMTRRNLVHISREPMQLSDVTIQPLLFTFLFVYIFGGAIPIPGGGSYVDFLLAGILALNMVTSTMGTAVGLSTDLHEGMIDRFRALPMWRSAVLVGRSMADLLTSCLCTLIVALTGLAVGWRPGSNYISIAGGFLLVIFVAYAISWVSESHGPQLEESRDRRLVRFHRPLPVGLHLQLHGPDPAHAGLDAGDRHLEPGQCGGGRRPHAVGQPEPVGDHPLLADGAPGVGRLDLVGRDHRRGRAAGGALLQAADDGVGRRGHL